MNNQHTNDIDKTQVERDGMIMKNVGKDGK